MRWEAWRAKGVLTPSWRLISCLKLPRRNLSARTLIRVFFWPWSNIIKGRNGNRCGNSFAADPLFMIIVVLSGFTCSYWNWRRGRGLNDCSISSFKNSEENSGLWYLWKSQLMKEIMCINNFCGFSYNCACAPACWTLFTELLNYILLSGVTAGNFNASRPIVEVVNVIWGFCLSLLSWAAHKSVVVIDQGFWECRINQLHVVFMDGIFFNNRLIVRVNIFVLWLWSHGKMWSFWISYKLILFKVLRIAYLSLFCSSRIH